MRCDVTAEAATLTLVRVGRAAPLAPTIASAVVTALTAVNNSIEAMRGGASASNAVEQAVTKLRVATVDVRTPLAAAALALVVPVLNTAMNGGNLFTVLDGALAVVELHAQSASSAVDAAAYPRMAMLGALAALLATDSIAANIVARARVTFDLLAKVLLPSELAPLVDYLTSRLPKE